MKTAKVYKEVSKFVEFEVFGKTFKYQLASRAKKVNPQAILSILNRTIVQIDYEWGRKYEKKVILFYEQSDIPKHVRYIFSVEADLHLESLMTTRYDDSSVVAKMLSYMYDNHEKLNFI